MKTKFKLTLFAIILGCACLMPVAVKAQATGNFSKTFTFNKQTRIIYFFVPPTYNPLNKYTLVVGLHGCTGDSIAGSFFRDDIKFLSDSLNAIIACPQGLLSFYNGFMGYEDTTFVKAAIDTVIHNYNIALNRVYLTGFSCNGYTTANMGLAKMFPFRGIIPFNPGFGEVDFLDGSFIYTKKVPTCICAGTKDEGYAEDLRFRDSLIANHAPVFFNAMEGIGHTTSFPTFKQEMMKCFSYFTSTTTVFEKVHLFSLKISCYPNPTSGKVTITCSDKISALEIYNILGAKVYELPAAKEQTTYEIDFSNEPKCIYFTKIYNGNSVYTEKIILQ